MKKNIFIVLLTVIPALLLYLYSLYISSYQALFMRGTITSLSLIGRVLIPIAIAAILIILSLYSLYFSKTKSLYILLVILFIIYSVFSFLSFFPSVFSQPTSTTAQHMMNDLPWFAGYYGGILLFNYLYNKKSQSHVN